MKKILSTLLLLTGLTGGTAYAQCTPSNLDEPGISPATLPNAKAGQAYNTVIQFKFPTDTTYQGARVHIDSAHIDTIRNLPPGFSFRTDKASRTYPGGGNGCALITGNPTTAMIGKYDLIVRVTAYVNFGGFRFPTPFTDTLEFSVEGVSAVRFASYSRQADVMELKQNTPNPFNAYTTIQYILPAAQPVIFRVYDLLGNEIYLTETYGARGENAVTFDRAGLKNGLYFYSIQAGGKTLTKRMMITN